MQHPSKSMKNLPKIGIFIIFFFGLWSCHGQDAHTQNKPKAALMNPSKVVGGPFENGEFMYIGMPKFINATDTSAGWTQKGQKLLITGTIYQLDGKTPAPNVILYYYHTDINGYYSDKKGLDPHVKRHGYIRGWVKSDAQGKYAIYTVRPASYPNTDFEAHIHPSIKEPNIDKEYYIDEFVFDDDPLLTAEKRKKLPNRGGSGVLRVLMAGNLQIAEHDIILGLHIPNYPPTNKTKHTSGLAIGEDSPSFTPFHAFGPDKGTRTCPVCKYGRYHGILYFVGNQPNWNEIEKWLLFLEQESIKRGKYLKVYFVYGDEKGHNKVTRQEELAQIGQKLHLKNTALTFVSSLTDKESEVNLNKINPLVENTLIIYRHRTIVDKFIDLKPTTENFRRVVSTLERTGNKYFDLKEPRVE